MVGSGIVPLQGVTAFGNASASGQIRIRRTVPAGQPAGT